jgi:LPXTG-motif cell wall-anchored protein
MPFYEKSPRTGDEEGQKMSLKSKVSISMCLLLAVSICIYAQAPGVYSWAWGTHQFITQNAINVMPRSLDWFFENYSSTIVSYCTLPDVWKATDSMEGYRHYDDTDIPHGANAVLTTENYLGKEILVYDESAISGYANGTLPWNLVNNFNMLVVCLKENEWEHAAQIAGAMAHYMEDASMPLHATSEYNPGGNHVSYEGRVDQELAAGNVTNDLSGFTPHVLTDNKQLIDNAVFDSVMQELADSYSVSQSSLLSTYLGYNVLWNDEIKTITDNRMPVATKELADVWLTAFYDAGLYTPSPPSTSSTNNYTLVIAGGVLVIVIIGIALVLYMRRR